MINAKFFANAVLLIFRKIDNVMYVYTERKFANMWIKNTV